MINQNPEQKARDIIDKRLEAAGWVVQDRKNIDWTCSQGIAVKEYPTEVGPADYVLFVSPKKGINDFKPVGIIEAKKDEEGLHLTSVEEQTSSYARSDLKYINKQSPLRFCYEATSILTRFTDFNDPKPCSREVFSFHRPETLYAWMHEEKTLRGRFNNLPILQRTGLRQCQFLAISKLEESFKNFKPRALIQMATGAGKTFTAISSVYRLLKHCNAQRILFLVDRSNLGSQAAEEFAAYRPIDDNHSFEELYNVFKLTSHYVPTDSQVYISTIQRLHSILRGYDLEDECDGADSVKIQNRSYDVEYMSQIPPEFFDFIIVDECHRSIYNEWRQVLDYFDAFLIGLTATPDKRTLGFFNKNIVSEYSHEQAVCDGVNVGFSMYTIETEIGKSGAKIPALEYVETREKLTRKTRYEQIDDDIEYSAKELDRQIVNPSRITTIIQEFKDILPGLFPGRGNECPKTLVFAKDDSHAADIVQTIRREFGESNDFCKKITYKTDDEDPKSLLSQFRNDYNPRIAVTVDMIATGTDIKAVECLIFMRDVRSNNLYQQMLGRGTRTMSKDDLQKVTPSAQTDKTHFVVIDTVGVAQSKKTDMRPLERKPTESLKDLLNMLTFDSPSEDVFSSVANRLTRLDRQLTEDERKQFERLSKGKTVTDVASSLLNAYNPDIIEDTVRAKLNLSDDQDITQEQKVAMHNELVQGAKSLFTGELNTFIEKVRKSHEQIIDRNNIDQITYSGFHSDKQAQDKSLVQKFTAYIEQHKNEIEALRILYNEPYRRKDITYEMIKDLYEKLKMDKPDLAPLRVYEAYQELEESRGGTPKSELTAIIALIRKITAIDSELINFQYLVDKNFQEWVFKKQAGTIKFTTEQMDWLRMIKDHVSISLSIEIDDLDMAPFNQRGGGAKMFHLFGSQMNSIISEMSEALVR